MSRNWGRKIQVTFGDRSATLDDFDISFLYKFTSGEEPNEIEVEIKNLTQTTINSHIIKDKQLIVNAGYEGDVGNIAKGYIADTDTGWNYTDKDTQVIGFDSSEAYLNKWISKAYKENTLASEIIRDLCSQTGLAIGEISLVRDVQYLRGRSVNGKLRDIIKDVVINDCLTNMQVRNGIILIRNIGQGLETGFVLSAQTGLIGSPEPITNVDDSVPVDRRPEYNVRCLLNYKIGPSSKIKIVSKTLNANAVVINGQHMGSKEGPFETHMEVKLI